MTNPHFPSENSPIKLYGVEISGHSHRVQLMLSLLDLPYELIPVNVKEGEHKSSAYIVKHPFGQVPLMDDNSVILWDSNAILVYLATKYAPEEGWYPRDAETMAQIQKWLSVAAGPLVEGPCRARASKVLGKDFDYQKAFDTAHVLFDILEIELHKNRFICTDHATIADVSLYTYTAHAPEGGIDMSKYPTIQNWLKRVEALKGFVPMKKVGG